MRLDSKDFAELQQSRSYYYQLVDSVNFIRYYAYALKMNDLSKEGLQMNERIDVDELARQTRRRGFEDGLYELLIGGVFIVIGTIFGLMYSDAGIRWYAMALMTNRTITVTGFLLLYLILLLSVYGGQKLIVRIRREVLWKESGFLKPLRMQESWTVHLLAVAAMLGVVIINAWFMHRGMVSSDIATRSIVVGCGIATGVLFFGMGLSLRLQRYVVVGIAGGMLSTAVLLSPISFSTSWILLGIGWGIVLLASGSLALQQTLKALRETSNG